MYIILYIYIYIYIYIYALIHVHIKHDELKIIWYKINVYNSNQLKRKRIFVVIIITKAGIFRIIKIITIGASK